MKNSFTDLIRDDLKLLNTKPGSFIKGTVMDIEKNWVTVDTGLKTEGVLPADQFKNKFGEMEISVGDEIELLLESVENGFGRTMVSYEKAKFFRSWKELEEKFKRNETIQGIIKNKIPGGFSVDIEGIKAFLPGSLIEIEHNTDPKLLENISTDFKIIKIDKERNNLIVSHRAIGRQKFEEERHAYFDSLVRIGQVRGQVKQIVNNGAFISLEKGNAFLRKLDIAWETVEDPHDYIEEGKEYEFKVLTYNPERRSLLLSLREMSDGPWDKITENYEIGQSMEGIIRHVNEHGLLVEITPGLVGLVHVSELSWEPKPVVAKQYGSPGDTIMVKILGMEPEQRKLSLSHRACLENPWKDYAEKHAVGDVVEGTITAIQPFGIFVRLAKNVDGFIHPRNLDWDLHPNEAIKNYKTGQEIKSIITFIDTDSGKVILNLRRTQPNHFAEYMAVHPVKSQVTGKVTKIGKKSVVVALTENITGIIPMKELGGNKADSPDQLINPEQELKLQILYYDPKKKHITLSMRQVTIKEEKEALVAYRQKKGSFMAKLGDLLSIGGQAKEQAPAKQAEPAPSSEDPKAETEIKEEVKTEPESESKTEPEAKQPQAGAGAVEGEVKAAEEEKGEEKGEVEEAEKNEKKDASKEEQKQDKPT